MVFEKRLWLMTPLFSKGCKALHHAVLAQDWELFQDQMALTFIWHFGAFKGSYLQPGPHPASAIDGQYGPLNISKPQFLFL